MKFTITFQDYQGEESTVKLIIEKCDVFLKDTKMVQVEFKARLSRSQSRRS